LIQAWFEEADKNMVLPLDDRGATEILNTPRPTDEPARERYGAPSAGEPFNSWG